MLKKSDELNDACRTFFEKLKSWLKQNHTESFYSKDVRSVLRITPSSIQRYLHELELMGYIKIVRGSRYKDFEYKVNSWNDLEFLTNDTRQMVKTILETINSVARNPTVTQTSDGLHKVQKGSKKKAVTQ